MSHISYGKNITEILILKSCTHIDIRYVNIYFTLSIYYVMSDRNVLFIKTLTFLFALLA